MTATPEVFLEKDKELDDLIQVIQSKEKLVAYEILARFTYINAEEVLVEGAQDGEKRLIFTHTIKQANEFKQLVENNTERKALALWSNSNLNAPPLTSEQLNTRQYIIDNESFPDDLDDLIFTEAFSTGWNLVDDRVTTTIVHSSNDALIKQVCGRTTRNRYLSCTRKHHWWNTYWVHNKGGWWELRCLFCHHTVMMGEDKMSFIKYIFKTEQW